MFNRFIARALGVAVASALLAACGTGPAPGTSTLPSGAGLQSTDRAVQGGAAPAAATPNPTPTPCGYCPPNPKPHACPQLCSSSTQRETSAVLTPTPSPTPRPPCYCPPNPRHICPDIACVVGPVSEQSVKHDAAIASVRRLGSSRERRLG